MSGLCGWALTRAGVDPLTTIRRMTGWLPEPADMIQHAATEGAGGLGCRVHPGEGGFLADGDVWCTWAGTPRWRDEGLAALSTARGMGAALVEAWRRFGPALLERLAGHVAVAVVEPATGRAVAAIDRAGVHGLAYALLPGGGVVFGSTVDAVAAHPGVGGAPLTAQALHDYLAFVDRVPAPTTAREGVSKLVPGECLVVEDGRAAVRRFWSMPYRPDRRTGLGTLAEELRETLAEAVERAIAGEVPREVGAFLSGGLDSSTVAGLFAGVSNGGARAFTIAFDDPRFDESAYARMAAERFGLDHDVFTVRPADVAGVIDAIATAYDEPFGNSSAVPAYLCARRAREAGVGVMLAGDGGDELFAGNARYLKDQVFQRYRRIPAALRRGVIEPVAGRLSPDSRVTLLRKAARYVGMGRLSVPARVLAGEGVFSCLPPEEVLAPDVVSAVDPAAPLRLAEEIWQSAEGGTDLQRFLALDLRLTLADGDLRKVGRMAALAGVRVRYPMLDDDVMALSGRVPPEALCAGGRLRAFYKDAFSALLPAEIIDKPKHGFGLPYQEFLATDPDLRAVACDAITDLKGHGLFRRSFLDGQIAHLRGQSGAPPAEAAIAWDLVVLHRWLNRRRAPGLTAPPGAPAAEAGIVGAAE